MGKMNFHSLLLFVFGLSIVSIEPICGKSVKSCTCNTVEVDDIDAAKETPPIDKTRDVLTPPDLINETDTFVDAKHERESSEESIVMDKTTGTETKIDDDDDDEDAEGHVAIDGSAAYEERTDSHFLTTCLREHNRLRARHGAPPLLLDQKLMTFARARAVEIAASDGSKFYHPDDLEWGENLAWVSDKWITCDVALGLWYEEIELYNYTRPQITSENGHFTQVIWHATRRLGCGLAVSLGRQGGSYVVCNYDPPGNILGLERKNVLRLVSSAKREVTTTPAPIRKSAPTEGTTVTSAASSTTTTSTTTKKPDTTSTSRSESTTSRGSRRRRTRNNSRRNSTLSTTAQPEK